MIIAPIAAAALSYLSAFYVSVRSEGYFGSAPFSAGYVEYERVITYRFGSAGFWEPARYLDSRFIRYRYWHPIVWKPETKPTTFSSNHSVDSKPTAAATSVDSLLFPGGGFESR